MENSGNLTTQQKADRFHVTLEIINALNGKPHNPQDFAHYTTEQKAEAYPILLANILQGIDINRTFIDDAERKLLIIRNHLQNMR